MRRILGILTLCMGLSMAGEKVDWDYPLGPIGGRVNLQYESNLLRVNSVQAGAPGALAGLQDNDYIYGAFDSPFKTSIHEDTWGIYIGPLKGLGEAIDKAERGDGLLPLMIIRSGVGPMTLNVQLSANGGYGPTYPLGSTPFSEAYEAACASIHENLFNETWRGNSGYAYPYRWAAMALLSHPNWNDTSGDKPYRLSINKARDICLNSLANAQYAPVEQQLMDGTANPNFVNQFAGHENWALNTSLMFLAEYLQKTKDDQYYEAFQTGCEKIANRIQWWSQRSGRYPPAGGAHAGVHSDYNGCGFNICVAHSFAALAMAAKVTDAMGDPVLDTSVRARCGRHFGYAEGETKPASALPTLPDGWDINVDPSIAEKMAWQWQQLKESTAPGRGGIYYWHPNNTRFPRDGAARTAGAVFAYHTYLDGASPPTSEDADQLALMTDFLVRYNRESTYAHTHSISAVTLGSLAMTYYTPLQRRHFLENWKFYWNLARQPSGPPQYFAPIIENDNDSQYLLGEIFTAIPYGVASGGFDLIPGWDSTDLTLDFSAMEHEWKEPEFRELITTSGNVDFSLVLFDHSRTVIPEANYTASWSVIMGESANVSMSDANSLTNTVTFSEAGTYDLQLAITSGTKSLTEVVRVHVCTHTVPSGHIPGQVLVEYWDTISGTEVITTNAAPDMTNTVNYLDLPPFTESTARRITGHIVAKETGDHRFFISSVHDSELWMDINGDGNLVRVAFCNVQPNPNTYGASTDQRTDFIPMTAGDSIEFMIKHKTDTNDTGHLSMAWKLRGGTNAKVDCSMLSMEAPAAPVAHAITSDLADSADRTVNSGQFLNLGISGPQPILYQWYRNDEPIGPPISLSYLSISPINAGSEADYHCVATTLSGPLTSNTFSLNVTDEGGVVTGSAWMDYYTNTNGGLVADLEDDVGYPWDTVTAGTLSSLYYKTATQTNNHLGHRVTAWLTPTETANYRFIVTGDDDVDFYFSPTSYASHKQRVAQVIGSSTGERTWSDIDAGISEYFPMQAGQSYYIELIHKENLGASHFGVALQKEGDPMPTNGTDEIPGSLLSHPHGGHFGDVGPVPPHYPDELYIYNHLGDATYHDPLLGGRYGDASGNGVPNLFYYLFDMGDPSQVITPSLQLGAVPQAGMPLVSETAEGIYTYSYVAPNDAGPLTISPLISSDLSGWLPVTDPEAAAQPTSTTSEALGADYHIHHLNFNGHPGPLFFRIQATE